MSEILFQRLQRYASQHRLRLAEKLGTGIHGLVHVAFREGSGEKSAVKVLQELDSYIKERDAYRRLRDVHQIRGFYVPQLLNWDDQLWVLEMSIVNKPYLLDFAGVSLRYDQKLWTAGAVKCASCG